MKRHSFPVFALAALSACSTPRVLDGSVQAAPGQARPQVLAIPASNGLAHVDANWKERLAQPYVFLELRGDYRRLGDGMRRLLAEAQELELELDGTPFALFYDDPGRVALDELRARVCLPVGARPGRLGALQYDVLPRAMVVYARVPGAYPEVARSYPALFAYLGELGWSQGGPVREQYLVNPLDAAQHSELLTEVQIPWSAGAE
jgi:effector-binding domain-containing protein